MKRNIIPFALIAILGIALVIIMSAIGTHQQEAIQKAEEGSGGQEQSAEEGTSGGAVDDPEAIFKNNCAACHGADLSGGVGPNLQKVGSKYSQEEIADIVKNGKTGDIGTMPGGLLPDQKQVEAIAKWLSEKK